MLKEELPPLSFAEERGALMQLLINCAIEIRECLPVKSKTDFRLILVLETVLLGHALGTPMTVTQVTERLQGLLSYGTAHRSLSRLTKMDVLVRIEDRYYVNTARNLTDAAFYDAIENVLTNSYAVLGPYLRSRLDALTASQGAHGNGASTMDASQSTSTTDVQSTSKMDDQRETASSSESMSTGE
jgi:hypothetical protein